MNDKWLMVAVPILAVIGILILMLDSIIRGG